MHQRYKRAVTIPDGRRVYKEVHLDAPIAPTEGRSDSLVVPYRASLSNCVITGTRAGASVVAGARTLARARAAF